MSGCLHGLVSVTILKIEIDNHMRNNRLVRKGERHVIIILQDDTTSQRVILW